MPITSLVVRWAFHAEGLARSEQLQQAGQPLGEFPGQQELLGAVVQHWAIGQLSHRIGAVAAPGAEGVGNLRGDPVDERLERSAADHVRRQGRHDREADLLGYIFSRSDHRSLATLWGSRTLRSALTSGDRLSPVIGHDRRRVAAAAVSDLPAGARLILMMGRRPHPRTSSCWGCATRSRCFAAPTRRSGCADEVAWPSAGYSGHDLALLVIAVTGLALATFVADVL
jgi:hypothetical protein